MPTRPMKQQSFKMSFNIYNYAGIEISIPFFFVIIAESLCLIAKYRLTLRLYDSILKVTISCVITHSGTFFIREVAK